MKIRVQHEDGKIEILTLRDPITSKEGIRMNRLVDAGGVEHFFTEDGHYDGWGRALPGLPDDETDILVEEIQGKRAIERSPTVRGEEGENETHPV